MLPALSTTLTDGIFLFTDRFNGRLPEGRQRFLPTPLQVVLLTSVGGNIVNFPVPGLVTGGPHEGNNRGTGCYDSDDFVSPGWREE